MADSTPGFTFRALMATDPYYPNWLDLRRRDVVDGAVLAASLLAMVLTHQLTEYLWLPVVVSFGGVLLARWHRVRWPCPRCGRPFDRRLVREYLAANSRCGHCGLPKYAPHGGVDGRAPSTRLLNKA